MGKGTAWYTWMFVGGFATAAATEAIYFFQPVEFLLVVKTAGLAAAAIGGVWILGKWL